MGKWPWYATDARLAMLVAGGTGVATGCSGMMFLFCLLLALAGIVTSVLFYKHNCRLVFNRHAPPLLKDYRPLWAFFKMTRPLETAFRLLTAPLRDRPDIVLVGETRCGTTTLSAYIKSLPGAQAPFCPWIHPLEGKEAFYFVGHYFGVIHPAFAGAPYPFIWWRWLAKLQGRPYFCFDGCAQYLNAPWVARLLHKSAPNARILACIREPVQQAISWWAFEHAGMAWGTGMPLGEEWIKERGTYPPESLMEAFEHSQSQWVQALYRRAERESEVQWLLPLALGTWPGGQLAAIGRSGSFLENIERFESYFGPHSVTVFEMTEVATTPRAVVAKILKLLPPLVTASLPAGQAWEPEHHNAGPTANRSIPDATKQALALFFRRKNEALFTHIGRTYPWHETSYYGGQGDG